MIRTKCQVCDGPVVNGRCKYCGMPYRDEAVLYHLNESREEHYRHAGAKARNIMRKQGAAPEKSAPKASIGRTSSREENRAHQENVRKAAMERMTAVRTHGSAGFRQAAGMRQGTRTKAAGNVNTRGKSVKKTGNKNGTKTGTGTASGSLGGVSFKLVRIIVLFVLIVFAAGSQMIGGIREEFYRVEEGNYDGDAHGFYSWERSSGGDSMYTYYSLGIEYGAVETGVDLESGTYQITVDSGSAEVSVSDQNGTFGFEIGASDMGTLVTLEDGDQLHVDAASGTDHIILCRMED